MFEMSTMLTFGAPNNSFIDGFTLVGGFLLRSVLFHFFSISIVYRNWIKTNGAFGEHDHAFDAIHNLDSVVLCKIMVAFEFWLFGVDVDFFGENGVNLWGFTSGAIKCKGFGKIFSFPYNFDIKALFIKLMFGDSA